MYIKLLCPFKLKGPNVLLFWLKITLWISKEETEFLRYFAPRCQ